jgi:hypothetical protein
MGERLYNLYTRLATAIADFVWNLPGGGAMWGLQRGISSSERATGRGVNAPLMTPEQARQKGLEERAADIRAERESSKPGRALGQGVNAPVEEIRYGQAGATAWGGSPTVSAPAAPSGTAQPPVVVQSGNTTVTVNVNGGNPAEVRRVVLEALAAERRKNNAAIPRPGSG